MTDDTPRKDSMNTPVAFSRSPYWKLLRHYYTKQGPQAWDDKIPFQVTSNPSVAYAYAQMLIAYYQDWVEGNGIPDKPLYILELGAGHGRFSYYLLNALEQECSLHGIRPTAFRLVLSDMAEKNIASWLENPAFSDFLSKGLMDCMDFDLMGEPSILTRHRQFNMHPEEFVIPPVVISHYVFDSLPIDVFRAKNRNIQPVNVSLSVKKDVTSDKTDVRRYGFVESVCAVTSSYYGDKAYDSLLRNAADKVVNGYFSFPIATLRLLDRLKEMTGGRYVLSLLDKGDTEWSDFTGEKFPPVFYHQGAFSFDLNIAALTEYVEADPESFFMILLRRRVLKWGIYSIGFKPKSLKNFQLFCQRYLNKTCPLDLFALIQGARDMKFDMPIALLIGLLSYSQWDPMLFSDMGEQIVKKIKGADHDDQLLLSSGFEALQHNNVSLVGKPDIDLVIGKILYQVDQYADALAYFERSISEFGEGYANLYMMGKAHFSLGDSGKAAGFFSGAQKYQVTKQLSSWMKYLKIPKLPKAKRKAAKSEKNK